MDKPINFHENIPVLNSGQMAEVDKLAVEGWHIELLMMMENAGRALALQAKRYLRTTAVGKRILVMAGKGNNGGGGLASARHLHNWGAKVEVVMSSSRENLKAAPGKQLRALEKLPISIHQKEIMLIGFDLILDCLLGYNQKGNPRGRVAELVLLANNSMVPILALDIPTGLNPDTGRPNFPCIKARQTITLAAPKVGLLTKEASPYVGDLFLADVSVPAELFQTLGLGSGPSFVDDEIVLLRKSRRVPA